MRIIALSITLVFSMPLLSQQHETFVHISQPYARVLFYNVQNLVEFNYPPDCDTAWLEIREGYTIYRDTNSVYVVPTQKKPDASLTLGVISLRGTDTLTTRFGYQQAFLPDPVITLSHNNINLADDLNQYSDTAIFENLFIIARFPQQILPWIPQELSFKIQGFTICLGETEIRITERKISNDVYQQIYNLKRGTVIEFKDFEVGYPDGRIKTFPVNAKYIKKTKAGVQIPRKTNSLVPDEG